MVWESNPGGGKILRIHPDQPWDPPSLLYNGYWVSFPAVKQLEHGIDIREIVQWYPYSPFGPSWPVLWWTLPLLHQKVHNGKIRVHVSIYNIRYSIIYYCVFVGALYKHKYSFNARTWNKLKCSFYPSPPVIILCVMVFRHRNTPRATTCTCAMFVDYYVGSP